MSRIIKAQTRIVNMKNVKKGRKVRENCNKKLQNQHIYGLVASVQLSIFGNFLTSGGTLNGH